MVYSTNQNRQMYVVNDTASVETAIANLKAKTVKVGSIAPITTQLNDFYIAQKGYGGIVRSDLVNLKSIMWATASAPADTAITLKSYKVELKEDLVVGEDYLLRIMFTQAFGMSDEDIYVKDAVVHVFKGMDEAGFYTELAASLVRNFKRLYQPLVTISSDAAGQNVAVRVGKDADGNTILYDEAGTEVSFTNAIYINEMSQESEWSLGRAQYVPVQFQVIPTTIFVDGDEVVWGKVTDNTATYNTTVGNGYNTADLEYFCMGERGDQYRNLGWPKNLNVKYMADPTKEYYYLDIHYAYQGTCEDIQKSEKTLTIAAVDKDTIEAIITALDGVDVKKTANY